MSLINANGSSAPLPFRAVVCCRYQTVPESAAASPSGRTCWTASGCSFWLLARRVASSVTRPVRCAGRPAARHSWPSCALDAAADCLDGRCAIKTLACSSKSLTSFICGERGGI